MKINDFIVNFAEQFVDIEAEDISPETKFKELEEWEPETMKRFHSSRNLIRKEPEEKKINKRSLVDRQGLPIPPKAPKGYYVDESSVKTGINPMTGFAYRHYTLVKLKRRT